MIWINWILIFYHFLKLAAIQKSKFRICVYFDPTLVSCCRLDLQNGVVKTSLQFCKAVLHLFHQKIRRSWRYVPKSLAFKLSNSFVYFSYRKCKTMEACNLLCCYPRRIFGNLLQLWHGTWASSPTRVCQIWIHEDTKQGMKKIIRQITTFTTEIKQNHRSFTNFLIEN